MRSEAPNLLPVFRSRTQAAILAEVLLRPDLEFSLTDLSQRTAAALSTVHAEVARLVTAEVFTERLVGRSRLVRANPANLAVRPLTELVALTFGPFGVVRDAFREVPGVYRVLLYGSWAARYSGESGPPPRDIDVLVIGDADRVDVFEAAEVAERQLRLPVNPIVVSPERFAADADPLIRQVKASPTVTVHEVA